MALMQHAAELRAEKLQPQFERLRPLHVAKRPPEPGDWLAEHPEKGQSFSEYAREHPQPFRGKHVELLLLGDFSAPQREAVQLTADYIERYFGMPVRLLPPVPLDRVPPQARRNRFGHEQILTGFVLQELLHPSPDALAAIALTAADLYPDPSWNFVFGQASLRDRVGVWSIFRNGEPGGRRLAGGRAEPEGRSIGDALFLRRTVQTAVHELSHMLGIEHCIAWECLMNGSNHQAEKDARPLWLCPHCLAKLHHALGKFDLRARFTRLADFCRAHGLAAEAAFFAAEAAKG